MKKLSYLLIVSLAFWSLSWAGGPPAAPPGASRAYVDSKIDDTKGNGDTTFVWSADKTFDELALKLSTASLGANVGTFLGTPTSANFFTAISDEGAYASTMFGWANAAAAKSALGYYTSGDTPDFASVNIGNADTTITRVSAGVAAVEGSNIITASTGKTKTTQTVTIADSGADSDPAAQNLTPTAGYDIVDISLACNDDDGCTITFVEGGSETNNAIAHIVNTGSYNATFADSSGVNELISSMAMAPYESLTVQYKTDRWVEIARATTTIYASTLQGAFNVIPDADGIVLTAAQMNSVILMTGAGDVDIPADQCDTATGKWLTVKSTAAHLNSVTSNDASDLFVTSAGVELTAANELDLAGGAGNQVTVVCLAANKWYVMGEIGTSVDGGAAD